MSGKKGRSGGPRANSGGARPGSGPKPKAPPESPVASTDPEVFMTLVMADTGADLRLRLDAAKALLAHRRQEGGGKKEAKQEEAKEAGAGKFAPGAGPRLVVNNG